MGIRQTRIRNLAGKKITGVIVFLSREFGRIQLGKDRFTIINRVVAQALSKYNAALQRNPKLAQPARLYINPSAQQDPNTSQQDEYHLLPPIIRINDGGKINIPNAAVVRVQEQPTEEQKTDASEGADQQEQSEDIKQN